MCKESFGKEIMNILDIIFPRRCPLCDEVIPPDGKICPECIGNAELVQEPVCKRCGKPIGNARKEYCGDCDRKKHFFDSGKAVFVYQGAVQHSLYRFKYANRREYAAFYGKMACIQYARWISRLGIDAIIPVPLHRKRRRERGYNQAELFAKEIGKRTGIPVETKLLYRCINTRPQKELNDQERKKNLKKAFTIAQNIVQLRKVLLVGGERMDVRNCKGCGRLFNYYGGVPLCKACKDKLEEKFQEVKEYLRQNPNTPIQVVSEDNNVSVKQIKQWVREERLVFSEDSPLGLECEGCGTIIKTGRFCEKCKRKMETDFQSVIKKKPVEPQLDKRPKERDKMRYL